MTTVVAGTAGVPRSKDGAGSRREARGRVVATAGPTGPKPAAGISFTRFTTRMNATGRLTHSFRLPVGKPR